MSEFNLRGIDISSYQKGLSKASLNSVDFAILKISEGTTWIDPEFNNFYKMAAIPLGAYVYSRAITEDAAINEAKKALSIINGRDLPLGIYIDVEEKSQMALRDSVLTGVVKAFCNTIKDAGYKAGAYGSSGNLWAKVGPSYLGDDVIVWVAQWTKTPPKFGDIWQFTSSDRVDSYNANVDGDKVLSDRFAKMVTEYKQDPILPGLEPIMEPSEKSCEALLRLPILQYNPAIKSLYVEIAQKALISKKYSCGAHGDDGYFGKGTLQGVLNYQEENGLPQTGIIDSFVWTKLLSI